MKFRSYRRPQPLPSSIALLCIALTTPFITSPAEAASYAWDSNLGSAGAQDGTGIWNATDTNWVSGATNVAWANGNDALFGAGADGTYVVTVALDPVTNSLIFNNSGYTLSADSLQTITVNSTSAAVSVAVGKTATIGANLTVGTAAANANSVVTGGGTLLIESGGVLRNNGTANSNVLRITGAGSAGTGAATTVQINAGGSLMNSAANNAVFVSGIINVNGGSLDLSGSGVGGTLGIGQDSADSAGTITLTSGIIVTPSSNGVRFGSNSGSTPGGTLNLNGGTLSTSKLIKGTGTVASSVVNFNGGTLKSTTANSTFMEGLSRANVRNGGAVIDATSSITIKQDLLHSNLPGDNAIDGGLTKTGTATLTLAGTNTYTGNTTIAGGTLSVSSEANLGDASSGLRFDGGLLQVTGTAMTATSRSITWGAGGGGFDIASGNTFTVSQNLGAGGGLTKRGSGTLILTGNNSYSGVTTLAGGTLQLTSSNSVGTSAIDVTAADAQLQLTNDLTVAGSVRLTGAGLNNDGILKVLSGNATLTDFGVRANTGTRLNVVGGSSLTIASNIALADGATPQSIRVIGSGTIALRGDASAVLASSANSFLIGDGTNAGPTVKVGNDLAFGTGTISFQSNSGSTLQSENSTAHTLENPVIFNAATATLGATGTGALTFKGDVALGVGVSAAINNAATTFDGMIYETGAGLGITKGGLGTLTLNGNNIYTGPTVVETGALIVNGSISGSPVTVNSSGTLGGSGTVGTVNVLGGTVAPGDGPGTLSTSDFSLDSTSMIKFELAQAGVVGAGKNDLINVTGNLTLDGTLQITGLAGFTNGTYQLFTYSGTLTNNGLDFDPAFLAAHPGSSINTASAGAVNLVVIPEPTVGAALLATGGMMLGFNRSRRRSRVTV